MLSIGITTFKRRIDSLTSMVEYLKSCDPEIIINIAVNGEIEEPFDEEYYRNWQAKISGHLDACRSKIAALKKEGKKIAGFGAAAKGCIFLNAAGLTFEDLEYVVDDTDIKQGKYVPGTGLQVVGREALESDPVDYLIILAHNFADHISVSLRKEFKGKFLVFLPDIAEW